MVNMTEVVYEKMDTKFLNIKKIYSFFITGAWKYMAAKYDGDNPVPEMYGLTLKFGVEEM